MTEPTTTPVVETVVVETPEETPKTKFFTLKKKLAITGAAVAVAMVAVFVLSKTNEDEDSDETDTPEETTEVFELDITPTPEI